MIATGNHVFIAAHRTSSAYESEQRQVSLGLVRESPPKLNGQNVQVNDLQEIAPKVKSSTILCTII